MNLPEQKQNWDSPEAARQGYPQMRQLIGEFLHASRNVFQQQHAVVELTKLSHPEFEQECADLEASQDALFQLHTHLREYIETFDWQPEPVELTELLQSSWHKARGESNSKLELSLAGACSILGMPQLLEVMFADCFRFLFGCCSSAQQLQSHVQQIEAFEKPFWQIDISISGELLRLVSEERWFIPFCRLPGLNHSLAFARRVAEAHGGQLTANTTMSQRVQLQFLLAEG